MIRITNDRLNLEDVMLEIDAGVGLRAGMPPGGDVMSGRIEEGAESELGFGS